jgi:hypothetical protein
VRTRPEGITFPDHLRSPDSFGGCSYEWHYARLRWLKSNELSGGLTEIRAMTNPHLSARLHADPDSSIGGPRRQL